MDIDGILFGVDMPYKNPEKAKENKRKYRKENKLKIYSYNLKYNLEHSDIIKNGWKKYYKRNKERIIQRISEWKKNNPENVKRSSKKYFEKHPDKFANDRRIRRANKNGVVGGHFTYEEFEELKNKTGNKCLCCERTNVKLEADHVIPISLKQPNSDEITNIQPLCTFCNRSKGAKIIDYRR